MTKFLALPLALATLASLPLSAQDAPLPKLGPNATPITQATDYLRQTPAPDYWAFAPYVKMQFTTSACSVAAVTGLSTACPACPPMPKTR